MRWKIDEVVNRKIIRHYTRESGVRNWKEKYQKLLEKLLKKLMEMKKLTIL